MVLSLEEIQKALQGCDLTAVAFHTNLHINTVRKYRDGAVIDPPLDTVKRLSKYLSGENEAATRAIVEAVNLWGDS